MASDAKSRGEGEWLQVWVGWRIQHNKMNGEGSNARTLMEPIEIDRGGEDTYTPHEFADWREIPSEALERREVPEKLADALGSLRQIYREVLCCATWKN